MSFEAIERAATPDMVVMGTGHTMNKKPKFHKPSFDGAMVANCSGFGDEQTAQRLQRKHAKMQGFEPCQICFPGDRR